MFRLAPSALELRIPQAAALYVRLKKAKRGPNQLASIDGLGFGPYHPLGIKMASFHIVVPRQMQLARAAELAARLQGPRHAIWELANELEHISA
jgi:hypothetical protein